MFRCMVLPMLKRDGNRNEALIEQLIGRGHDRFNVHAGKRDSPKRQGEEEGRQGRGLERCCVGRGIMIP